MLIPSVSCQRLSCSGKDEVLCLNAFEIKVKCKIKGFLFLKCFSLFAVECLIKQSASPPLSFPLTVMIPLPGG